MTGAILGWQVFILVTMVVARLFSSSTMVKLGLFWTVWTFVMLVIGPLILLQLVTIWFPVALLAKPSHLKSKPVNATIKTETPLREPGAASLSPHIARNPEGINQLTPAPSIWHEMEVGAKKLNEAAKAYRDKTVFRIEFEKQFSDQRIALKVIMRELESQAELEKKCGSDPQFREIQDIVRKRLEESGLEVAQPIKLPNAPRTISWPSDPIQLSWAKEAVTAHLGLLEDAYAKIRQNNYLKAADQKKGDRTLTSRLEEEAKVLRDLLGIPAKPDTARRHTDISKTHQPIAVTRQDLDGSMQSSTVSPLLSRRQASTVVPKETGRIDDASSGDLPSSSRLPTSESADLSAPSALSAASGAVYLTNTEVAAIRNIVKERAIPHLTHFTRAENLQSILQHGLLSRAMAQSTGVDQPKTDGLRLDRRLDRISTSIAFPNFSMFYKYRAEDADCQWVVLLLKKEILWTLDCVFTTHNAADARVLHMDEEDLRGAAALERLFVSSPRPDYLRPCDPTDPQAEVMVKSRIGPELIEAIAFETTEAMRKHSKFVVGAETFSCGSQSGLFASRQTMLEGRR